MQVIAPARPAGTPRVAFAAGFGIALSVALLATGIALGYLAFGTSFVTQFALTPRPGPAQVLAGVLGWTFGLTAPGVFLIVGLARAARVAELLAARRPARNTIAHAIAGLEDDYVAASRVSLPDGRPLSNMVLGPFGIAVLAQLPPRRATRRNGDRWEVRMEHGWAPLENPLERAARDADRVRRWIAADDTDFVVKVYAAVVGDGADLARTPACAVLAPEQVADWLRSLPPQRSLSPARRGRLLEMVRAAV